MVLFASFSAQILKLSKLSSVSFFSLKVIFHYEHLRGGYFYKQVALKNIIRDNDVLNVFQGWLNIFQERLHLS